MQKLDTSPDIQKVYDEKIRALSEEERFLRGLSLTHFCRMALKAGIQDKHPDISEIEFRIKFFERIYGPLFSPKEKSKIISWLAR